MRTVSIKPADVKKNWVVFDAAGQTVGRLATEIARTLRGKNKVTFTPHIDGGDHVVVFNAEKVNFTGNKLADKTYWHHTLYIGGIKGVTAGEVLAKHPERILESAVRGMLPKNKLGRKLLKSLKVYAGTEHPHAPQKPVAPIPRTAK